MVGKTATALSALLLGAAFSGAVQAQDIKLYAFSSGALTLGKGYLQNGAPMTPQIQVPVGFFVVDASERQRAFRYRQQRQDHHRPLLLGRSVSRR